MALVRTEMGDDRVAVITLDDPGRRNALGPELVRDLVAAVEEAEAGGAGALVVTGSPPAFCAGADLSDLGRSRREGLRAVYEGFLRVARSPLPTVAAVGGAAVGAGTNLALACDVRIASPRARFDTRFLGLGLHPGGGHTWMLRRIAGPQAAAAMVLCGDVLGGEEAERVGLVWRCVPEERLLDEAVRLAAGAAAAPGDLVRRTKQTLAAVAQVPSHDDAVDLELEAQLWSLDQPAFAERLRALRARIAAR